MRGPLWQVWLQVIGGSDRIVSERRGIDFADFTLPREMCRRHSEYIEICTQIKLFFYIKLLKILDKSA